MEMEPFIFRYLDEPAIVHRFAERLNPFFDAATEALIGCGAEVVWWGANYDQDVTWPASFRGEIVPWLQATGDRLRASGKLLAELRQGMGATTTLWGGIPSIALLDDSMSSSEFSAYLDTVFGELGTGERLILGVSDNVPPDANIDRLERITERVAAFGAIDPAR